MTQAFEALEFEWEEGEAWRRRGAMPRGRKPPRSLARGSQRTRTRPAPTGKRPPPRRWPPGSYGWYGWPAPAFGWWPYRGDVVEPAAPAPEPAPYDEPAAQPGPDDGSYDGDGADQGETPPTLGASLARMPAPLRPAYQRLGSLAQALTSRRATGPGLYLIEFDAGGRRRAYSGQTGDLRVRLQRHAQCARMMGVDPAQITTYVAVGLHDADDRRRREYRLHDVMFRHAPGVLTNQRREMELELPELHPAACACARCCAQGESFEIVPMGASPLDEAQELALAMELLSVGSEAELDQFLGKMFKGIWKGVRKVAKPLGGILKGIAKKALPLVGGALGSLIPVPGVGTALGSALGGALGKALEMEGVPGAGMELELARRFVRIAAGAAQAAGDSDGSAQAARSAVLQAMRRHAPGFGQR